MARITRYTPSRLVPLTESDFEFMWPVSRLHQEMNRLFSDVLRGFEEGGEQQGRQGWMFNPVVDVEQQDEQYEISAELPGVRPEDVNVELSDDMLTISGSKERKETRGEGENRQSERVYGSFRRSFRLPEDAVRDNVQAHFNEGVLTVIVPRDEGLKQAQARRIEVQRSAPQQLESGQQQQQQQQQQQAGVDEQQGERPSATH